MPSRRSSANSSIPHEQGPLLQSQFDIFLPTIVDLKFRDQKDTMERPSFSLSKSKRMKPIEYINENDGIFVTVQPHQDYGMATIWDADILIWAASVLRHEESWNERYAA